MKKSSNNKKKNKKKRYLVEVDELRLNKSIIINYNHDLLELKRQMSKEYFDEIKKIYKENIEYIVVDENIVDKLEPAINRLDDKWSLIFRLNSNRYAKNFVYSIDKHNNNRYNKIKKENPFLIKGTEYRENLTNIIESSIAENVNLIKSIPKKFHDDVLRSVMSNVGVGGDLQQMSKDLSKISGLSSKRISFICRDQAAKATALLDRQKAINSGFTTAIWQKSVAGMTHRKDHAEANEKEFDISKGCLISGEYILPRMKPNCKCSYKLVIKFEEDDDE